MAHIIGISYSQVGQPIASITPTAGTIEYTDASSSASGSSLPSSQLSTLAQQLSDSALRAEERDNALIRKELGARAEELLGQIQGPNYHANKARHDSEVPNTNDPALLARAQQATDFVNTANNGRKTPNPFAGLSSDQLSLIIYDDNGNYTVNERRAASYEAAEQRQAWKREVVAKAMAEYKNTGKMTNFYSEVLAHYESLPPIEQAQYPVGYTENLQQRIDDDTDHRPKAAQPPDPFSLFAVLDRLNTHGPESK